MAKKRNKAIDYSVFLVIRVLVCFLQSIPLEWAYQVAKLLAHFVHAVDKRHRKVALENIRLAFGDRYNEEQRKRLVFDVYHHFCKMFIEMMFIPRKLHKQNWKKYAQLSNATGASRAIMEGRPIIVVTGHFGNWEMAGVWLAAFGLRTFTIARDIDNPYLDKFLRQFRQWTGQTMLSKNGDIDKIQKVLENRGVLVTLADQSAGERGYFVDFFGRPASTHKSIAVLSMRYDAQVVVGYAFRDSKNFHYTIECSQVLDPRDYESIPNGTFKLTEDFTRLLENAVRKAPEQYFWVHNRWKHKPRERSAVRKAA